MFGGGEDERDLLMDNGTGPNSRGGNHALGKVKK